MSPAGVNAEFRPLLRMTFPEGVTDLTASGASRDRLFRSWLLLGGIVPVEYDDVVFEEVEPGHRFLERSSLLTQRVWQHERLVDPVPHGSRLTDRIAFAPRIPGLGPLFGALFQTVFRWRHRNLRRIFGELPGPRGASAR